MQSIDHHILPDEVWANEICPRLSPVTLGHMVRLDRRFRDICLELLKRYHFPHLAEGVDQDEVFRRMWFRPTFTPFLDSSQVIFQSLEIVGSYAFGIRKDTFSTRSRIGVWKKDESSRWFCWKDLLLPDRRVPTQIMLTENRVWFACGTSLRDAERPSSVAWRDLQLFSAPWHIETLATRIEGNTSALIQDRGILCDTKSVLLFAFRSSGEGLAEMVLRESDVTLAALHGDMVVLAHNDTLVLYRCTYDGESFKQETRSVLCSGITDPQSLTLTASHICIGREKQAFGTSLFSKYEVTIFSHFALAQEPKRVLSCLEIPQYLRHFSACYFFEGSLFSFYVSVKGDLEVRVRGAKGRIVQQHTLPAAFRGEARFRFLPYHACGRAGVIVHSAESERHIGRLTLVELPSL